MKIKLNQLKANPFRDMTLYPIDEPKVDALVESIAQTDFWDNLIARPVGNALEVDGAVLDVDEMVAYLRGLNEAYDEDGSPLFEVELAYGHHRWFACQKAGLEEIDIPVKWIDDETMLRIMANENKGDWSSNMNVILETVRQVGASILATVVDYETYEDYVEAGNEFFTTAKQFNNAKSQGIGFKTIAKFLGETWSENDVRNAHGVLQSIEEGLFLQEQVTNMPSTGMIARFNKLCKAIHAQVKFPLMFKERMVNDVAAYIVDDNSKATVKVVDLCSGAVKKGNDPMPYLKSQKRVEFVLWKALKTLMDEEGLSDEELKDQLGDFADADEAIIKAREAFDKAKDRREPAGGAGEGETGEGVESSDDQQEVDDAIAEAEAAVEADPGIVGEPEEDGRYAIGALTSAAAGSAGVFAAQCDLLLNRTPEIDDEDKVFFASVGRSFESLGSLMLEIYGRAEVVRMLDELEAKAVKG